MLQKIMNDITLLTIQKPVIRIPSLAQIITLPVQGVEFFHSLSFQQKAIIYSITGLTIFGMTAKYFRRRRRKPPKASSLRDQNKHRKSKSFSLCNSSGELHTISGNMSHGFHRTLHRQSSFSMSSDKSGTTLQPDDETDNNLAPQQFGVMGMEALENAINLWEDALSSYTVGNVAGVHTMLTSQEEAQFTAMLQKVIDEAYTLQDQCEHLFLHQHSVLFRSTSVTPVPSECAPGDVTFDRRTLTSMSSVDSFVSCPEDIANLSDFEDVEDISNYPLYAAAIKYHDENCIQYRDVRTDWVKCNSDLEYICKVHCIRYACQLIFSQEKHKEWFIEAGREIVANLLTSGHKDPKDAIIAYDELLEFIEECNWDDIKAELELRGLKAFTFYDIVLDFILMDAFEDLENPPSSVLAVVQNRWLSNGFKESALSTAVWSVIKAKRRLLKYQDGFLSHFYDVSEHISPMLAWGFLGPNQALKDLCFYFKDQIQGLLQDMFNFNTVRYTTIEELSEDILNLTHQRYKDMIEHILLLMQIKPEV